MPTDVGCLVTGKMEPNTLATPVTLADARISPTVRNFIKNHPLLHSATYRSTPSSRTLLTPSGLVYFSGIFTPEKYGDMWGFSVHPILSNPLKYSSLKILYHNGEFLI
jgi:hypothetical protein